jgi:hypothetical protein
MLMPPQAWGSQSIRAPLALVAAMVVFLGGCPKRGPDQSEARIRELVGQHDVLWAERGEDLVPAETPLLEAYGISPQHNEVLWRLARVAVSRGLSEAEPRAAAFQFGEARALGLRCLRNDGAFAQREKASSLEAALRQLPSSSGACAAWGVLGWARWIGVLGGEATALDLPVVLSWVKEARSLDEPEPGIVDWAEGLVRTEAPDWAGGDPTRAQRLLEGVLEYRPGDCVVLADLLAIDEVDGAAREGWLSQARAAEPRAFEQIRACEALKKGAPGP